jgi:hypothetical protein
VKIPIAIRNWIVNRDVKELVEGEEITVALMIPDGDVMEGVENIVETVFGLKRQEIEGLEPNFIVMAGVFLAVEREIDVVMKFVYEEENMDLRLTMRGTNPKALEVFARLARDAFQS